MKPDKGNGIVIIDKIVYKDKMKEILNDNTKFKIINGVITKLVHRLEGKISRFLKTLQKENINSKEEYSHLTTTGSTLVFFMGYIKCINLTYQ